MPNAQTLSSAFAWRHPLLLLPLVAVVLLMNVGGSWVLALCAAVVMGALSPRTRNAQVALYQNGDVDYLVATDAIGMGLNLDVTHVAFAALSNLAPLGTLGPVVSPQDDARMWQSFARAADCPTLVALFDRLLARPAPLSGPPAIIHGDTKLSNIMWTNGQISAVLDWEMTLNGEPLANLGYMLYSFKSEYHDATRAQKLGGMLSRDEVIALWEQVSGRSAQGVFWHEIAQIGKIGAIIAEGANMYNTGRSTDPKLVYFKQNLDYYLGVMAAMLDGGGF